MNYAELPPERELAYLENAAAATSEAAHDAFDAQEIIELGISPESLELAVGGLYGEIREWLSLSEKAEDFGREVEEVLPYLPLPKSDGEYHMDMLEAAQRPPRSLSRTVHRDAERVKHIAQAYDPNDPRNR